MALGQSLGSGTTQQEGPGRGLAVGSGEAHLPSHRDAVGPCRTSPSLSLPPTATLAAPCPGYLWPRLHKASCPPGPQSLSTQADNRSFGSLATHPRPVALLCPLEAGTLRETLPMTPNPQPGSDTPLLTRQKVQGECQGHQGKGWLGSVLWLRNCQEPGV